MRAIRTAPFASLTGLAVNVLLKLLLMGSLAQVGLALATAVGAWINLLLVLGFAVRAKYLLPDRAWIQSLLKFLCGGVILAMALWLTERFVAPRFSALTAFPNESALLLLVGVGAVVYSGAILVLFGRRWLRVLVRG